jgi:hypothetical protein
MNFVFLSKLFVFLSTEVSNRPTTYSFTGNTDLIIYLIICSFNNSFIFPCIETYPSVYPQIHKSVI